MREIVEFGGRRMGKMQLLRALQAEVQAWRKVAEVGIPGTFCAAECLGTCVKCQAWEARKRASAEVDRVSRRTSSEGASDSSA